MSPAVFAKSDQLNLHSLIYLTAQEGNSHGNYDELLLEVSDCPDESGRGGCHLGPGPSRCETVRHCRPEPLSPYPGTRDVGLVDLRIGSDGERLTERLPCPRIELI